jgi:CRISPR-associated endonuclease/helicase Cas3
MSILAPWGKARPTHDAACAWHPAAYHCLDVAASASALLDSLPLLRARLRERLDVDDPVPLLVTLIGLHDIGKFSRAFQQKVARHWVTELYGDISAAPEDPGHGTSGFDLWCGDLCQLIEGGDNLLPLARAIYGHHGSPVREAASTGSLRNIYGQPGLRLGREFAKEIIALMEPNAAGPNANVAHASWLVAGLTGLADWMGSSQTWFPYCAPKLSLADYWEQVALPRARDAIRVAGIVPAARAQSLTYSQMTGDRDFSPTPMQQWVLDAPIAQGLYLIEDSTGAGKTEAAVMLAYRMVAAGLADGLYIALPTMATADGMFDRMGRIYRTLFTTDGLPSLALAHGARELHPGFQTALRIPDPDTGNFLGAEAHEDVSFCSAWIADDRRKTFLAQVGVGTIDQAILGVLPSFHQSLRLLGLAQRILILDEVHAYDAYMNQEIIRLLEMQAALGGTTILLSATLPADTKVRLMRAYGGAASEISNNYPLATFVPTAAPHGLKQHRVEPRPETIRRVPLSFVAIPGAGLQRAIAAARSGQAVLYIRNTIRDAIETFKAIPADLHAHLFHARFAMCDRARIQDDVLARFGKDGTSDDRRGRLLVATQVVEQSLDLDFDLIVSDLAPIDLIVQRAGRLWRHDRGDHRPSERRRAPSAVREMVIVGPEPVADAHSDWLAASLQMTHVVYSDTGRMWLTADALRRAGEINAPDGLRPLIEHVYGPDAERRVPEGLRGSLADAGVRAGTARAAASQSLLTVDGGYARAEPWDTDERIMTRLGDPTTTLRLAVARNGSITPLARTRMTPDDEQRLWALSEVKIPRTWQIGVTVPAALTGAAEQAKASWSGWQRAEITLVVLDDKGATPGALRYDRVMGLTMAHV